MASTAKRSNLSIVREAYKAFNRGDIATVLGHMDDDIEWTEPAGGSLGGTYEGPDAIAEGVFGPIAEAFETFTVDVDEYLDCGRRAVVTGRLVGETRAGGSVDIPFAHVVELRDGSIRRFQNYTDTAVWNDALGA